MASETTVTDRPVESGWPADGGNDPSGGALVSTETVSPQPEARQSETQAGRHSLPQAGPQRQPVPMRAGWWQEPLCLWFLSRMIVSAALIVGSLLLPLQIDLRSDNPHAGAKPDLPAYFREYAQRPEQFGKKPMLGVAVGGTWAPLAPFVSWDSIWFLSVAEVGYVIRPGLKAQQNLAFFPLFPLSIRGLNALGIPSVLGGVLIANLATLLTAVCLYRLTGRLAGIKAARWSCGSWLFFPSALFGSVAYADSLLALCGVLSLTALLSDRLLQTGWWAGLATAIRPPGLALATSLIPALFSRRWPVALIAGILGGSGITAYFGYLWAISGDPLLYPHIISQWRTETLGAKGPLVMLLSSIREYLLNLQILIAGKPLFLFRSSHAWEPLLLTICLTLVPAVRRLGWGPLLSVLAMIWLPLSVGGVSSFGRYMWAMMPVFVVLGMKLSTSRWRWGWLTGSVVLLVWLSLLRGGGWEVI